jgi:hypothetical protein
MPRPFLSLEFYELRVDGVFGSSYTGCCIDHLLGGARDRSKALWAGTPEPICFGVDEDAQREHSRAAVRPMGESQNTQPLELRFRALLTEATTEMQLALVWRIRILAAGARITSNSLPSAPIL